MNAGDGGRDGETRVHQRSQRPGAVPPRQGGGREGRLADGQLHNAGCFVEGRLLNVPHKNHHWRRRRRSRERPAEIRAEERGGSAHHRGARAARSEAIGCRCYCRRQARLPRRFPCQRTRGRVLDPTGRRGCRRLGDDCAAPGRRHRDGATAAKGGVADHPQDAHGTGSVDSRRGRRQPQRPKQTSVLLEGSRERGTNADGRTRDSDTASHSQIGLKRQDDKEASPGGTPLRCAPSPRKVLCYHPARSASSPAGWMDAVLPATCEGSNSALRDG